MKISKINFAKVLLIGLFLFSSINAEIIPQEKKQLNPQSVSINWKGYKVTGEHEGLINLKSGNLIFTGGELSGGEVVVDMASIKTTDLEGEYAQKLEGHLMSDDFFGVATYPEAVLSIVNVEKNETGYLVTGALKIKKDTHQIKFAVTVEKTGAGEVYKAKLTIDRSKYDVRYGSTSFFESLGDKAIYDDFDLWISIQLNNG